jgi:GNAT superfamily N-acetyltransferase
LNEHILIRPAVPHDLPEIIRLWRVLQVTSTNYEPRLAMNETATEWFLDYLRGQMDNREAAVYVAVGDSCVVGYVFGQVLQRPTLQAGNCGYIADLVVQDRYRGRGLGRTLYETLRDWFHERDIEAIEVQVVRANPASQAFWRKMGFGDFLRTLRNDGGI